MTRRVVLVTGATGLIGRATVPHLIAAGFEVVGLERRVPVSAPIRHVGVDLFDALAVRDALASVAPSHVLHLAWDVTPGRFVHGAQNLDWVAATMMFARAAALAGARRFVGVGTCAEYGWSDGGAAPRREDDPIAPDTLYGTAKHATRMVLARFFAGEGIGFAWARPFHLFGPGEHPSRLVGGVVAALRTGRGFVCRHGQLRRDFIATTDLGAALTRLVETGVEGPVNVATGTAVALGDLVRHLGAALGRPDLVEVRCEPAPGQPASMQADIARLRGLGFAPGASLWRRLEELAAQPG